VFSALSVPRLYNTPDGCFIPGQTGRLTVGRNIRLRLKVIVSVLRSVIRRRLVCVCVCKSEL
jgi:hypothetical protein